MGTVSNPAKLSSIKAAWTATQNNFASYYRGGPIVNIGDSATIPTVAAGMKMSQFNGVAAQHTTSFTTSYTTTFNTSVTTTNSTLTSFYTTVVVCLEKGTMVELPDGRTVPVENLRTGDTVLSVDFPGLKPETSDVLAYKRYRTKSVEKAALVETKIANIRESFSEYLISISVNGHDKPLRVTPTHPLFVYDTADKTFKFIPASTIDCSYKLLDRYFRLLDIREIELFEGEFTIYRVDCSPYDVFFHEGVLGHNMKISGTTSTQQLTSASTITTYASVFATSNVTSNVTSVVTFG